MDPVRVAALHDLLAHTGWVDGARDLARALRRTRDPGGLVLVGTPDHEPWHLTAHLDDEARFADLPELTPTLARWRVPPGAPPHLSVGLTRLEQARRGETVFVVAPDDAPEGLLGHADDARRRGATLVSLDGGDAELASLAHERMVVSESGLAVPPDVLDDGTGPEPDLLHRAPPGFDVAQHLVSAAAGRQAEVSRTWRDRLEALLEKVSGPGPSRAP